MYYRYSTLLEQRSTLKLAICTPLSSYISSFLHDDLENDDLENDDGDGVARRIKRLEGYRRQEIRGR